MLKTTIRNDSGESTDVAVNHSINRDGAGAGVIRLDARSSREAEIRLNVPNAHLWSLDDPYLYQLHSTVTVNGGVVDRVSTSFGIRTVAFDKDNGFLLNGKRVEIKGACNHQDHAGVGAALPGSLQRSGIEQLKEMGANAYRTSHNPPTPELLDACDRLGMLVMDENRADRIIDPEVLEPARAPGAAAIAIIRA